MHLGKDPVYYENWHYFEPFLYPTKELKVKVFETEHSGRIDSSNISGLNVTSRVC
jgi:hypothetical protein